MNCCCQNNIDCYHLQNLSYTWTCNKWETILANPETAKGCSHYITPGEHELDKALQVFLKQMDDSIEHFAEEWHRDVIVASRKCTAIFVVGLTTIALYLWWVL